MSELVKVVELPFYLEDDSSLVVAEGSGSEVPFVVARVFNVQAKLGVTRGKHAHILCNQLLICANGSIEVSCDDGVSIEKYILDKPNTGLMINSGVWAEQTYLEDNTVLTVLCDRPYEKNDYMCEYEEFKTYIKNKLN